MGTEQRQVYALTVEKGGPRIKDTREGSCVPLLPHGPTRPLSKAGEIPDFCGFRGIGYDGVNRKLEIKGVTLAELARMLTTTQFGTVMDRTGLSGTFDISLRWASCPGSGPAVPADPDTPVSAPPECGGPAIFTAIKEQLGPKLEPAKGSVRVMVIDKVEKPSEN